MLIFNRYGSFFGPLHGWVETLVLLLEVLLF